MTQYAYWKQPDGRPYKGKDGKHAPIELLNRLGSTSTINAEGKPQWTDIWFQLKAFPAILSLLTILDQEEKELNSVDSNSLIREAINFQIKNLGGEKPVPQAQLLHEVNRVASIYFRRPKKSYFLTSSYSMRSFPCSSIKISDCVVSAIVKPRKKLPLPLSLTEYEKGTPILNHFTLTKYQKIRVRTQGRSEHEAYANARHALDLLRALWTLFATENSWTMHFRSTATPRGVIHAGPVEILYTADGNLVGDHWWVDSEYSIERDLYEPSKGWVKIEKNRKWAQRKIARLAHRVDVENLLVRYVNALDYAIHDLAFLQLWAILEKITDTIGANYDETVRRAARIFPDASIVREIISSLRSRRNEIVHSGKQAQQRDQAVNLIKSLVDPHLFGIIKNDFDVESLKGYAEFLSLPADRTTLQKRQKQCTKMLKLPGLTS